MVWQNGCLSNELQQIQIVLDDVHCIVLRQPAIHKKSIKDRGSVVNMAEPFRGADHTGDTAVGNPALRIRIKNCVVALPSKLQNKTKIRHGSSADQVLLQHIRNVWIKFEQA